MKRYYLMTLLLLIFTANFADTDTNQTLEHVIWNRTPIAFEIPTGKERMLTFPSAVEFKNTNPELTADKVRILNNNGTLYMKAKRPFDPIRIAVVVKKTGEAVLMDVSSTEKADDAPVEVAMLHWMKETPEQPAGASTKIITYADLMRYAVQHLYTPKRLIDENPNIHRTPMFTSKSVHLIYGGDVMAMPIASWRGGDLYVSAVILKAIGGSSKTHLNPNKFIGRWLAVSFYPSQSIQPYSRHDRTVVFLISDEPFNEALHDSVRYAL